jgi:DNA-binding SARP family transcriptional activator/tetratricopeptide (TPR) repeat protein
MAHPSVHFRLLGPVRVDTADGPVDVGGATARAVLALLLIQGEAGVNTEEIISSVWGPGGATRDSVYHYLSTLRKALRSTGTVLEARSQPHRLRVDPEAVDWHRFRRLVAEARTARDRLPEPAATLLRTALGLWRGPPLADVGERLTPVRRDMRAQRLAAIETLAAIEASRGRPDEVVILLLDELSTGPVREGAAVLVIDALVALGRRDDAGEVYRQVRQRLVDEQGLDPSPQLVAAHRRMLDSVEAPVVASSALPSHPIAGLPRPDPHFTDRDPELRRLVEAIGSDGTRTACGIYGMGGAGKTALAVHAAYTLKAAFPDGVIFLDLHGYANHRPALTAAETLHRLLHRMRVDGVAMPTELDELVALYNDLLDGRRILVVLDNAHDAAQVGPALPRPDGCAAIVTSRRRLAALDDVLMLSLDVLPQDEGVRLFRSVAGVERLRHEPAADATLARIVDLCGGLPLAIRIAAGRYRARAKQPLADLETKLSDETERLTEFDDEDRSVATSFRVSLADLPPTLTRTFGLLALHLGAEFDVPAAAALADLSVPHVARQLATLSDRHLITEQAADRYRFHDLVAAFGRQHAVEALPAPEQTMALRRLADYYLRAAEVADERVTPHRYRVPLDLLDRTVAMPSLADYEASIDWFTKERSNLVQVCLGASVAGFDSVCWQLAYTLRGFYFLTKDWQPWIVTHEAALAAARRCHDDFAEATTANNLGLAHLEQGATEKAAHYYQHARRLFTNLGNRHGEYTSRANLAWLLYDERRFADFLAEMRPVYEFYRSEGAERNAAITLRGIGLAEAELGHTVEAVEHLRTVLATFERLDLRLDTAMTWNGLGETHLRTGHADRAKHAFVMAAAAAERCGSVFEHARAHHGLGDLAASAHDRVAARAHWTRAWDGYRRLRASQADDLRRSLDALDE